MNKRGNALAIIGFFFLLFLLFITLRSANYTGITGKVIDNSSFSVDEILFTKIEVLDDGSFELIEENTFHKYENIGCVIDFSNLPDSSVDVNIGFYSNENNVESPNNIYSDIFNDDLDNTLCDDEIFKCLVYYNLTNYVPGRWNCFVNYGNETLISNDLIMENRAPILLNNIPSFNLALDGSLMNGSSLDLDDYFIDLEGDDLTYGSVGQFHIDVSVASDGEVNFENPDNWEGVEVINFRAYDGEIGTFSNNVTIFVGRRISASGVSEGCNPFWDCEWAECSNNRQSCVYYDRNECTSLIGKPVDLVRSCSVYQTSSEGLTGQSGPALSEDAFVLEDIKEPEVQGTKRTLLLVGIVVLILIIIGFGVYLIMMHNKNIKAGSKQEKKDLSKQNIKEGTEQKELPPELCNYVDSALHEGQKEQKIFSDLLNAGWEKKDLEEAIARSKLKIFIKSKIEKGFDKQIIINSLKAKGWKDKTINPVLKDLNL